MKWQDFFFFSKSQQIGVVVLLVLIAIATASIWIMPCVFKPNVEEIDTTYLIEAKIFRESLAEIEQAKKDRAYNNSYTKREYPNYKAYKRKKYEKNSFDNSSYELFDFNPNVADENDFLALGLKPYIAKNIIKYRNKGGYFKTADDFSKIYGIDDEKFAELKPFIKIESKDVTNNNKEDNKADTKVKFQEQHIEIIELNTADTTQLIQLPRLGRYTAYAIIRYRRALGGFHSVEQLKEVKNMRLENYEIFAPYCIVDKARIRKIDINKASVETLKRHPYIGSFQRAKAIYDFRRYKIKLTNIKQLKAVQELSEKDLKRLKPYLKFE